LAGEADGAEPTGQPDVEIRCSGETLWRMLDGSYSPVEAFREGQLRVRGDDDLAKRVLRHIAGPDGSVDCI
jgi:putative sterol carrier protein